MSYHRFTSSTEAECDLNCILSFPANVSTQSIPTKESKTFGLYLGSQSGTANLNYIKNTLGIGRVLVVADNAKPLHPNDLEYKVMPISDTLNGDLLSILPECIKFIEEGLQRGSVIVHCLAGISRSASVIIAFLMYKNKTPFNDALNFVKKKRPRIDPNMGFLRQLQLFESMTYDITKYPQRNELYRLEREVQKHLMTGPLLTYCLGVDTQEFRKIRQEVMTSNSSLYTQDSMCMYACKCGRLLFSDLNLKKHQRDDCKGLYVEVMSWMTSAAIGTEIKCPKCCTFLGSCNWSSGNCSSCNEKFDHLFCFDPLMIQHLPLSILLKNSKQIVD